MSTNRISPQAGWVWKVTSRGPNGRGLCRQCGAEVPVGRRTFCGGECVHRWRIKTDPGYVRDLVYERDKGICSRCGLDTVALGRDLAGLPYRQQHEQLKAMGFTTAGFWWHHSSVHYWEAHHKVAVVEGGGECDLDGYETVCVPCHKRETAGLRARRAEHRKQQKPHTIEMALEVTEMLHDNGASVIVQNVAAPRQSEAAAT